MALFSIDIECDSVKLIAKHFENYLDAILEIFKLGLYSFDSDAGCIFVEPKDRQLILSRFEIKSAW